MSAVQTLANPHRIKAAHRWRWKCSTGHSLYANDNPYRYTDPDGRIPFGDPNTSSYVSVDVAGSAAGTLANALNWVDTNIAMPLGPDGGAELHIAIAPMVGALREAAAVTKTAEAAKTIEGGTKEAVSMSKAVDKAIAHTGSDAEVG